MKNNLLCYEMSLAGPGPGLVFMDLAGLTSNHQDNCMELNARPVAVQPQLFVLCS